MLLLALAVAVPNPVIGADAAPTVAQAAPPAPDYAKSASWAARPGHEGAAVAVPAGAVARQNLPVDVFYIHPTTDTTLDRWNQPVADGTVNAWTDGSVIGRQAAAFNGCCRVFAPRYRQATSGAQRRGGAIRDDAFALAYADVKRAFRYYLDHDNKGRPFILAGHSQGAAHLERLLDEEIDGKPLAARLVAAYDVGITFPAAKFDRPGSTLTVCDRPDRTGCVVHWGSILASADLGQAVARAEGYNRTILPAGADPAILCINPLTFSRSVSATSRYAAKGAVPGAPDATPLRAIVPHAVSARCERGFLVVDPDPTLDLTPLPGGSMHYHDIGLFFEDIRENAILRARTWLAAHRARH
ncbi:DUF3089 domain-containing protein [Novosphingobium sp. Leaf2]|uniref:DUF3089 domain-containing protein n=1 Tax=Novosphingobium sp. Leaf2 TaxID=1735670 RepID=UPI00071253CC|nr:DUF3089 domain-containing protein [Novosphingobium sp. Leaf2]KQM21357.1 hypothetical protein ASE49_14850 [Novosphingobium sp. Leaf2]